MTATQDTLGERPVEKTEAMNQVKLDVLPVQANEKSSQLGQQTAEYIFECEPELDPWALPELMDQGVKWSELSRSGKVLRVFQSLAKLGALLLLLYFFICSLDFLSSAFRLLGGKVAGDVLSKNELLSNPVVGLMIGVLVTVLVQSSSTSTSIVITMVGTDLVEVRSAIPIIMGANIGTSMTNTIVSLMQASERNEFRRAFAAATVHDMFNWLTVIVLLPIEISTGYLYHVTNAILKSTEWEQNKDADRDFLKKLTKPFTKTIIQLDKNVITAIANKDETARNMSLIKQCCKNNGTDCISECKFLLKGLNWSDSIVGLLLLAVSLVLLCSCLILLVKLLHSMLKGRIAVIIKKTVNVDPRFPFSMFVGYVAILIGMIMTILVQSSSIFTSALTPLAGIGVISLERMYPLTLGSNIGTTATGILAALAADKGHIRDTLQLAFCHLFFNISGILLFYPLPFMRFPITLAKLLGNLTAEYRWFSIVYLLLMFVFAPGIVFGLSLAGPNVLLGLGLPLLLFFFLIIAINIIQRKRPSLLPLFLQNWMWLPEWLHSLDPLDRFLTRILRLCKCCSCITDATRAHDANILPIPPNTSQINFLDTRRSSSASSDVIALHGVENSAHGWNDNKSLAARNTYL
ncbi:sodium-dependent phosphate transport protein 2B-like [Limulus polyphemus]|uniref:Sodium-dependent phosphate transport protein 2B-like n=1 Tax=Limulus polyphemus TaxID=6850 RepID=A0ABM1BG28_LIMPO|nr:sodium-dependent phosphate transport protein 2B-like [Limulus polyphemus]